MKLLTKESTEYLIDAPLSALHSESNAWMKELKFWSDEIAVFYRMLHRKEWDREFPSREVSDVEKELVTLNVQVQKQKADVTKHERFLSSLVQSTSLSIEDGYRDAHRTLRYEILDLHHRMRTFRRSLFSFILKYEF